MASSAPSKSSGSVVVPLIVLGLIAIGMAGGSLGDDDTGTDETGTDEATQSGSESCRHLRRRRRRPVGIR